MLTPRPELASAGYVFDDALRVWRRDSAELFAYSDGDDVEQALATILRDANDLSVFSPELAVHCTDWPRRYHLNAARANLLRPLAHRLTGDILEIGAGCGAITRYLGECGGNVLALEGSQRRASIAALRTRDLPNVTVLNDRFDGFKPGRAFDVVTLIGVLEYAALFGATDNPVHSMLEAVRGMLKPDGILIIAIENQLGLKYLAGAPEDHLGIRMFGVHGLYQKPGVETFGRHDLQQRLEAAGFPSTELGLPFPDYKLPSSVLPPAALTSRTSFQPDILASQTATRDFQVNSRVLTFALERAWRTVGRNDLLADLANSFLFVASPAHSMPPVFRPDVLAYHYSVERQPAFCKSTTFVECDGEVRVLRESLSNVAAIPDAAFRHIVLQEALVEGVALDEDFGRLVTTPGWAIRQVADISHRYIEALFSIVGSRVQRPTMLTPDFTFPGDTLDIVPQNIVVSADGPPHAIDREWFAEEPLPVGYLLFRALTLMLRSTSICALPKDLRWLNRRSFFAETFAHLGFDLTQLMIQDYLQREARFMSFALGREMQAEDAQSWVDAHLPSELDLHAQSTVGLVARIEELSKTVADLRNQHNELAVQEARTREAEQAARLAVREAREAEQTARLEVQQARAAEAVVRRDLETVLRSNVWRATRPLRAILSRVKRAGN
ncbi:class I SAM-dependent methyltransferase [Paraburkholderia dipogonis]|uniref:class I SAM-dependent methyltransferase n=1 Tax=Paraburkholderia dipogonis TaxID=1211383 RepID=UPI0038BA1863